MGDLFGGASRPTPKRMPLPTDEVAKRAGERKTSQLRRRSGRDSTRLSRGQDRPGTQAFNNSLLGQAG